MTYTLAPAEVALLEAHDYEVEVQGGVMRVHPPAGESWLRKRAKVRRELRFVQEQPEAALAVAAAARLDMAVARRDWKRYVAALVPLPEDGLLLGLRRE